MLTCEQCRHRLVEYVAEREASAIMADSLQEHLAECEICQRYWVGLRLAERALRTYPSISPPPALVTEILFAVGQESQPEGEEWQLLPWDIWMPILACSLALLIAMMSVPDLLASATTWLEQVGPQAGQTSVIADWSALFESLLKQDAFWAIWSGVFATTAGLGVSLGLSRWSASMRKQMEQWETRLTHVAEDAMERWRHAG